MRILIVENSFNDLKKSRMPLGSYFQTLGNEVFYACPDSLEEGVNEISMSRNNFAPFQLIRGCARLNKIESKYLIDTVLSFRFIPNVLNFLASFRNRSLTRVAVITGLGYAFVPSSNSASSIITRKAIQLFYRIASKRIKIVAQNHDDLTDLGVKNGKVILGSGVTSNSTSLKLKTNMTSIKLLYVGRLLKSKGILTAIEIFEQFSSRTKDLSLTIAGAIDKDNPDSLTEAELLNLQNKEGVVYLGFVEDLEIVYKKCNILLFPSDYREGIPRVIIESMKFGLTIVTKDMPGCRETVNRNGYLMVESGTVQDVVDYLMKLDSSCLLINQTRSFDLFKSTFSSEVIYPQYLKTIVT